MGWSQKTQGGLEKAAAADPRRDRECRRGQQAGSLLGSGTHVPETGAMLEPLEAQGHQGQHTHLCPKPGPVPLSWVGSTLPPPAGPPAWITRQPVTQPDPQEAGPHADSQGWARVPAGPGWGRGSPS